VIFGLSGLIDNRTAGPNSDKPVKRFRRKPATDEIREALGLVQFTFREIPYFTGAAY
jgi:hypothetical protein